LEEFIAQHFEYPTDSGREVFLESIGEAGYKYIFSVNRMDLGDEYRY
jgi:hypothetical protein